MVRGKNKNENKNENPKGGWQGFEGGGRRREGRRFTPPTVLQPGHPPQDGHFHCWLNTYRALSGNKPSFPKKGNKPKEGSWKATSNREKQDPKEAACKGMERRPKREREGGAMEDTKGANGKQAGEIGP